MEHQAARPAGRARRPRTTSARVRRADRAAGAVITLGGSLVIVAVLGILVYLGAVVAPLFRGARVERARSFPLLAPEEVRELLFAEADEYGVLGVALLRTGSAVWFSPATGERLHAERLWEGGELTAWSGSRGEGIALGFADGTVRVGRVGFAVSFSPEDPAGELAGLAPGGVRRFGRGVAERTARGELRAALPAIELGEPVPAAAPPAAVQLVDYRPGAAGSRLAILTADGRLLVSELSERTNLLTGEVTRELRSTPLELPAELPPGPHRLLLASAGDALFLAWPDGHVARFDLRDPERPTLVERTDVVPGPGDRLADFRFLLGEQSLLSASSAGELRAWLRVPVEDQPEDAAALPDAASSPDQPLPLPRVTLDGLVLVPAHRLAPHGAPLTVLATSERDKTLLAGAEDGALLLHHATSDQLLAQARLDPPSPVVAAQIAPKGDGLLALGADGRVTTFRLSNPHPETTLRSLFGPIWYEGSPAPSYTWQSSSGTDDFEPKLSLVPLVFGTLKATLYSMLFAVPVALAAALYTSEFLDPRWRGTVKPAIELMASLPSVVLGFLAALVLAPVVESWLVAVLVAFGLVPLLATGFGYAWQALPPGLTLGPARRLQLPLLGAALALACLLAPRLAPPLERLLFAGDVKAWLDGRVGTGGAGIAVLSWPLLVALLLAADRLWLVPLLGRRRRRGRGSAAALEAAKYALLVLASFALALAAGAAADALGLDPRGKLLDTYVQRNALVVGFVMGFAVIPIIYTIAEDALSSVPQALRSASTGCGATRWQTATRVVLPVALSGIFSALMVGLGRAVGETMVVLMAAGNTPVMTLNPFDGLRTLSANIAVELPEAVKDGTLYRVLFLAALTLFVLTFVLNTLAELVRRRFRSRAYQL